jgi:hypothetical protein
LFLCSIPSVAQAQERPQPEEGWQINLPGKKPCKYVYCLKISFRSKDEEKYNEK